MCVGGWAGGLAGLSHLTCFPGIIIGHLHVPQLIVGVSFSTASPSPDPPRKKETSLVVLGLCGVLNGESVQGWGARYMAQELLPHLRGLCLCLDARGPGPVDRRAPEEACRARSVSGFQDRSSCAQESLELSTLPTSG